MAWVEARRLILDFGFWILDFEWGEKAETQEVTERLS
jgi:hypothetical protein